MLKLRSKLGLFASFLVYYCDDFGALRVRCSCTIFASFVLSQGSSSLLINKTKEMDEDNESNVQTLTQMN